METQQGPKSFSIALGRGFQLVLLPDPDHLILHMHYSLLFTFADVENYCGMGT